MAEDQFPLDLLEDVRPLIESGEWAKVVAVVTILMVAGPWMADATMTFTREIYAYIPQMTAGG